MRLYNTLSKSLENFVPTNSDKVGMYVCGPTVYDRPHIGNGRSVVVYDLLYRVLIQKYSKEKIVFVRNITDVDDKINQAAKQAGVSIRELTSRITKEFHRDVSAFNCLPPNIEPRVTDNIPEIVEMVSTLIARGHAYISNGHVYFSVASCPDYGKLAGRDGTSTAEQNDGGAGKRNSADFVLWKPTDEDDDESSIFNSPWGSGRPGWHIECSAMSTKYLGHTFDIHGGGIDLIFPHHTNEVAQSCSCYPNSMYARYWVHNGFLTVNGEKMSKSLGNFTTIGELLDQGVEGETMRLAYLSAHYRKPLDWSQQSLAVAKGALDSFYRVLQQHPNLQPTDDQEIISILSDDLNTPEAIAFLHAIARDHNRAANENIKFETAAKLYAAGNMLGLFFNDSTSWFHRYRGITEAQIKELAERRTKAKEQKDWQEADRIRDELQAKGITLEDSKEGTVTWRKSH
jgi:cysteinyl-tRNA synthetase